MKISFDRDKFIAAVSPALGFNVSRNTVSYADGILLECPGDPNLPGTVRVTSYDLDKGMRTSFEAEVIEEGNYIINTQKLMQIVRAMPQGTVYITVDDKYRTVIEGGLSRFEITAGRGEDFPMLPTIMGETYTLPQHMLKKLVASAVYACGVNDQRPAFNGCYFKVEGTKMTFVGCDGNRLAVADMEIPEHGSADKAVIVPAKILNELLKAVKDSEDDITIRVARRHIFFLIGGFVYFARMLDYDYINYMRIIPEENRIKVFLSSAAFRGAIERAQLVTEDKLGGKAVVKLDVCDNMMKVSSASTGGSIYEEIPASVTGEELSIAFNCRYLLDMLRAIPAEAETLELGFNGPLMGLCVENGTSGDRNMNFIHFVMPTRK